MKCRDCCNLENDWCDMKADSPDPDMERECHWFAHAINADRFRCMSDDRLADFLWGVETAARAYGPRGKKAWLDWLHEEARHG